jgi:hypothetical protein
LVNPPASNHLSPTIPVFYGNDRAPGNWRGGEGPYPSRYSAGHSPQREQEDGAVYYYPEESDSQYNASGAPLMPRSSVSHRGVAYESPPAPCCQQLFPPRGAHRVPRPAQLLWAAVPRPLVLFAPLRRLRPRGQDTRRPALAALEARCTKGCGLLCFLFFLSLSVIVLVQWTRTITDKDKKNKKHKSPHPVVHRASSAASAGLRLSCPLGRSRLSGAKRTRGLGTAAQRSCAGRGTAVSRQR